MFVMCRKHTGSRHHLCKAAVDYDVYWDALRGDQLVITIRTKMLEQIRPGLLQNGQRNATGRAGTVG